MLEEYDFLMEMDESGIIRYQNGQGISERIREWLATPEGTVADKPSWGNRLSALKFEPMGPDLNVLAEMMIAEKLPRDVRDISIKGILLEFSEIDLMYVYIDFGMGTFTEEVDLSTPSGDGLALPPAIPKAKLDETAYLGGSTLG